MLAPRPLLVAAVVLALAPSGALAQTADDPTAGDDPAAVVGDDCDTGCPAEGADDAAAEDPTADGATADDATADDDPTADEAADADDEGSDDADAAAPAPGTLDAALADGVVRAGSFAAPRAGRLRVLLVAAPDAKGPALGRLTVRVAHRGRVALAVRLTAAGESLLDGAEDDVVLTARTSWTSKRSRRVRTTERRVALPLDVG